MRATLLSLSVLLVLLGPAAATFGDNGLTTYTGRKRSPNTMVFGNDMVTEQALQATLNFAKDVLKGTWRPVRNDPPTPKQEVHLECLHSVAPEPLNWKMWCPGTDAKVVGWLDKSGAAHRQITLRPQAGMTSTMYQWFITTTVLGLMPPVVEFQGNHYHYYHLWHPLDHVESTWSLGPKVPIMQKGPPIYVLIHERYRNPANFTYDRHYETNGWFYVENAPVNLMKNRYVITMPYMGIPTWTMILEFNDTPEGLVVDVEVVAGVPYKGYDERAPHDGYRMAAGMNELFTAPLLAKQKGSYDWDESINAITRHVIEEFSNLQHFVPYLYEKCNLLGKAGFNWVPTLGTWLQHNSQLKPDSASISFYNMLEKMATLQVNMTGTFHEKLVDAHINILNKTFIAGAKALTTVNEQLSRKTFVPISNKLTTIAHNMAKAHGPHPEVDVTIASVKRNAWSKLLAASNVTTATIVVGGAGFPQHHTAGNTTAAPAAGNSTAAASAADEAQGDTEGEEGAGEEKEDEAASANTPAPAETPAAADTPAAAATPASAGTPAPADTPAAADEVGDAGDGDEEGDDGDEEGEEEGGLSVEELAKNPALWLRYKLQMAQQEPIRENTATPEDDADGNDGSNPDAVELNGRDAAMASAAFMDATIPHIIKSDIAKGILSEKLLASMAAPMQNASSPFNTSDEDAAVEVRSVSLGEIAAAVRASGSAKNVTGMLHSIKQDVLAAIMNQTVSFDTGNNSFQLPEPVLAALAAKHALHKGVLTTLLNKTDLGLGNVSFSSAAVGDEAYPGGSMEEASPDALLLLAAKKALLKGPFPALLTNGSVNSSSPGNITIQRVPHYVFASLARGNGNISHVSSALNETNTFVTINGTSGKPGLKNSLKRLGASVKRVKRLSKSFKPSLSFSTGGNRTTGNGTSADKEVKLQVKFWDQERAQP